MTILQAAFIPPRNTVLQSNHWRIQSLPVTHPHRTPQAIPEQTDLAPQDHFELKPNLFNSIKHIQLPHLASRPAALTFLNFNPQANVDLSKRNLFKQLTQALTQGSPSVFSQQSQDLMALANQIGRFNSEGSRASVQDASSLTSSEPSAAPAEARERPLNPRIQALRQQTAAQMGRVMARFEEQFAQNDSPRMKKLCRSLMAGFECVQKDLQNKADLSPRQQQKAAMALAFVQAIGHLHHEEPVKQGVLLQQWALLMEDLSQQGKLTPQAMIEAAQELNGSSARLQGDAEQMLALLGHHNLMQAPLADLGLEVFQTMQDMTPAELGQMAKASRSLCLDFKQFVLPHWDAVQNETKNLEQQELGLAPEVQSLIDQADELALRLVLTPDPEPPKGFEDGVLSLLRQFSDIIRKLQADQQSLQAQQASQIIQQRSLDKQFLNKLLEDKQYDQNLRHQRDQLQDQIASRYQAIAQALQQSQQLA